MVRQGVLAFIGQFDMFVLFLRIAVVLFASVFPPNTNTDKKTKQNKAKQKKGLFKKNCSGVLPKEVDMESLWASKF